MSNKGTEGRDLPCRTGGQISLPGFETAPNAGSGQANQPSGDPHVHTVADLAPLMVRYLMALHAAARARRLARKHLSRPVKVRRMERSRNG